MSDPLPAARFFGTYLQSVDTLDGERKQFLVLPPINDPTLGKCSGRIVWWERAQFVNSPRPKWTLNWEGQTMYSTFWNRIQPYAGSPRWLTSEPIVVKVTQVEAKQWILDKKTPYDFIRRLEKRARLIGVQIQGPTSVPQVVTATPSS